MTVASGKLMWTPSANFAESSQLAAFITWLRRERGLAFDDGESTPDVRCVAAGVRDHTGAMVAAMSVTVPISRWPEATRADLERLVSAGAARLSETLGYRPS